MKLKYLVEQALQDQILTPAMENQINDLLWSQEFDAADMEALGQLIQVLLDGTITCTSQRQFQVATAA